MSERPSDPAAVGRLRDICMALPEVEERPSHGGRGWLGVHLDVPDVDWDEVRSIVTDAYRVVAPAKLAALIDPV